MQNFDRHETSLPPTAPSYCLPTRPRPSVRPFVRPRPSVVHLLAAGPPPSFHSSLPSPSLPLSLFRPYLAACSIRGATTSFSRPHCERIRYTFACHRHRVPRRGASDLVEYAAAAAAATAVILGLPKWDRRGRPTVASTVPAFVHHHPHGPCISQVVCSSEPVAGRLELKSSIANKHTVRSKNCEVSCGALIILLDLRWQNKQWLLTADCRVVWQPSFAK